MLELIKKDILLSKKQILIILSLNIVIPFFMMYVNDGESVPTSILLPPLLLLLGTTYCANVFEEEEKNKDATKFLITLGYTRKELVLHYYVALYLAILTGLVIVETIALIDHRFDFVQFHDLLRTLSLVNIACGLFLHVSIKKGYSIGRIVFGIIILLISTAPTIITTLIKKNDIQFDLVGYLNQNTNTILYVVFAVSVLFLYMLIRLSVKSFEQKDL